MEYCLYSVITILADTFFKDEKEYQEGITMIDQKTSAQSKMNLASYEAALEDLKYAKEDITKLECELNKTKNDLTQANGQIENRKAEVKKLKQELNSK